ncbi:MAG: ComEC/Rec2 family competence protein [Bacteroidales bacterium]|nr:ComEC/Rec2 family competence protein [Bacteroidales bacterium]
MAAWLPPGSDTLYWTGAGCCLAAGALFVAACGRGRRTAALLSLFWVLGALCRINASLIPVPRTGWPPAERALTDLLQAIDAISFPHADTAALLKALLAGRREGLDAATLEAFRAAGASHILALSGLHLGILYTLLRGALAGLGQGRTAQVLRSILSTGAAGFFLLMTGAAPSLVRAFLFICLGEAARLLPGRSRQGAGIFCAALIIQLTVRPDVVGSLGFQLSYLALLGIVTVFPRLDAWYPSGRRPDPVRRIWSAMALTLSCQLFTAPLAYLHFHTFPHYFLLTNLGALPLTEAFLLCALPTLAPGCPDGIKNLADAVGQALIQFLETVASIGS